MRRVLPEQILPTEAHLMLNVAGGYQSALPIIFSMVKLRLNRTGEVFRHMVRRGITGQYFIELAAKNEYAPWRIYKAMVDEIDGDMKRPLTTLLDT